jgi:hypothetical protein
MLRLNGTGLCLTAEMPVGNSGKMTLRECAYGGPNGTQDWIGSLHPNSPYYRAPAPIITYRDVPTTPLYEYWIVSRKTNNWGGLWFPSNYQEVGHSFNAIIRKNQKVTQTLTNGVVTATSQPKDDGGWNPWHTYGFWDSQPYLKIDNGCSNGASSTECQDVKEILAGRSISQAGFAVRKVKVSESRAFWIDQNRNAAGCSNYQIAGGGGSNCNCVDYAARSWHYFLAKRSSEDFRPWGVDAKTPSGLVNDIWSKNSSTGSDFVDNGNTWQ